MLVWGGAVPASAQVTAMEDTFSHVATTLNGQTPSVAGTGTWVVTGSPANSKISTNGSQALLSVNNGVLGTGDVFGSYAFTPQPNTIYTLQVTGVFSGPISTGYGWFSMGFSSGTSGGFSTGNTVGPWMETAPQTSTTTAGWNAQRIGQNVISSPNYTVPAAAYGAPMQFTLIWNTATGQAQYYVNGTRTTVGTSAIPSGTFYAFIGQEFIGNDVNCTNVTLTAQSAAGVQMQDNFSYTTANITGHAPTTTPAGIGTWTTSVNSGAIISTDGEGANINTNTTGVPGTGSAQANYAFTPMSNTIYSVTGVIDFSNTTSADSWAGLGFSSSGTNHAPWMFVRPQSATGGSGQVGGEINGVPIGVLTLPASDYTGPISATVTWNTATGQANYYINNYLVSSTWTAGTYAPTGPCNVFFEGFKTGNIASIDSIALASQNLTTVSTWMNVHYLFTDLSTFATTPTPNLTWPTAAAKPVNVLILETNLIATHAFPYKALVQQIFTYCAAHNIKVGVEIYGIQPSATCPAQEGVDSLSDITQMITNITSIGATMDILEFDNPFHHGVLIPASQNGCQLSIPTAASEVNNVVQLWVNAGFPNIKVYDIENTATIGSHATELLEFQGDLATDIGKPLDGVVVDMDWTNDANVAMGPYIAQLATQSPTTTFGLIMNGLSITESGLAPVNDQQNMLAFEENMQMYYASGLPVPLNTFDFSSWASYNGTYFPHMVEPETTTDTYTNQMDFFYNSPLAHEPPPMIFDRITDPTTSSYTVHYVTDPTQLAADELVWHGTEDGPQGGIEPNAACAPNLVPLYEYYNATSKQYAYSLTSQAALATGFNYSGIKGYVFPDASEGGHALYQYYDSTHNFYAYSISSTGIGGYVGAHYANAGYTFGTPTIIGYMTPRYAPAPGTVESD